MIHYNMAGKSTIEWTDMTWNPATGCTKVSPGCKNCYADVMANRLHAMGKKKYTNKFEYTEHITSIEDPLKLKRPRMIFVNSMSDFFHERSTIPFMMKCFETMLRTPQHTYQILTKRPQKMLEFSKLFEEHHDIKIPPHIWMGVSVESQPYMERIEYLRQVRCHIKFISFEPLLSDIKDICLTGIDWSIIGGESGRGYRAVKSQWINNIIQQCQAQNVPVFFKQWGGITPKSGGRTINGRTYDEYPDVSKISTERKIQ